MKDGTLSHWKKYSFSIICANYVDLSMETESSQDDSHQADMMVNLIRRLSGILIYHVFSMKTPDNLQTNFTIKSL